MQVYTVHSPADLAYLWKYYKLDNLDNFLLQNNSKQITYNTYHSAMKSKINLDVSTHSSISRKVSSLSGRIPTIKKEDDSSSLSTSPSKIKMKYILTWCSS